MSDVPLEHLDFQYIRECKSGNEVERILKALRYEDGAKQVGHVGVILIPTFLPVGLTKKLAITPT